MPDGTLNKPVRTTRTYRADEPSTGEGVSGVTTHTYNADGPEDHWAPPGDNVTTRAYNPDDWQTGLKHGAPDGEALDRLTFTYDLNGDVWRKAFRK